MNLKTYGKKRSLRLKDFDYSQPFAYFVTICTYRKSSYFKEKEVALSVMNTIRELKSKLGYRIYCYCIMPDHLHLILNPAESNIALPKFIRMVKSKTAVQLLKESGISRLWQRSYYEHVLRKNENLAEAVNYVLLNPVRKGVVTDYREYQFCGIVDDIE